LLDFTSALYLGLRHGSGAVAPWTALTTGKPAALAEGGAAAALARAAADLVGCARALVAPSTLHLFWDLVGGLDPREARVCFDLALYPVARWAVERAGARGVSVRPFRHHDPASLAAALAAETGRTPVVVTDGHCPGCGRPAPLAAYLTRLRGSGGTLALDDTQALGVRGPGGSGSLGEAELAGSAQVVWAASLSKGFGVPLAVVAGSARAMSALAARSETRVHCSPPAAATLHAGRAALARNARDGDRLRRRLAARVKLFRTGLGARGLLSRGGDFPVQHVDCPPGLTATALHARLAAAGIGTVVTRARCRRQPRVTFIITARHTPAQIEHAVDVLHRVATPKERAR
jgi:8-amino-7-oxononanoate synthase